MEKIVQPVPEPSPAAAVAYHGKPQAPKMTQHRVELKFDIVSSCRLTDDGGSWRLENVSGKLISKGDDILCYRLVYSFPQGKNLGNASLLIKVWPELPEHGRRNGRPEVGFMVTPPSHAAVLKPGNYYTEPSHSVVVHTSTEDAQERVVAIYFSLVNDNFEPTGPPLWRLGVNDSMLLARIPALQGRWIPLAPVHPDPAKDPGVPIHLRPQHSPRWYWYRNESKYFDIFKGKLASSRMFDFIAGRYFQDNGLKGGGSNNLTRFGRATESKLILTHLLDSGYVAYECGTYPHPDMPEESCGTPDARLYAKGRTLESQPEWIQDEWNKPQYAELAATINWEVGNLEAKSMMKLDYKRLGPEMKAEHLVQMYWTMRCAQTFWGEYIRGCDETKECRIYHIYLIPDLLISLEACVTRMRNEMISGTPYEVACEHEQNVALVHRFRVLALWYNQVKLTEKGEKARFHLAAWPATEVALLDKMAADYDICRSEPVALDLGNEPATKRQRKKPAAKTTTTTTAAVVKREMQTSPAIAAVPAAAAPDAGPIRLTPASIMPMVEAQQKQTLAALMKDLDTTHKVMIKCMENQDYDQALAARVFHAQTCRLLEIHGICKAIAATTQMQEERDE
jgi:hypothetical protein